MPKSRNRKRDKRKKHYAKLRKIHEANENEKKKRDAFRQSLLLEHIKKAIESEPEIKAIGADEIAPMTKEQFDYLGTDADLEKPNEPANSENGQSNPKSSLV